MKFSGSLIRAGNNAKTIKSDKASKFSTAIMYLAPADLAGGKTVCPFAEKAGCKAGCLNTAGQGAYSNVQQARINKTFRYLKNRDQFMSDLVTDIEKFSAKCFKNDRLPAIRLNGTSDIMFERIPVDGFANIFERFPEVQFYDYTKIPTRAYAKLPENYQLTLSYSAANAVYAKQVIDAANDTGINVAVVYRSESMRSELEKTKNLDHVSNITVGNHGVLKRPVINGDETDLRFFDKHGVIVGLYAKGAAKNDQSGFVIG